MSILKVSKENEQTVVEQDGKRHLINIEANFDDDIQVVLTSLGKRPQTFTAKYAEVHNEDDQSVGTTKDEIQTFLSDFTGFSDVGGPAGLSTLKINETPTEGFGAGTRFLVTENDTLKEASGVTDVPVTSSGDAESGDAANWEGIHKFAFTKENFDQVVQDIVQNLGTYLNGTDAKVSVKTPRLLSQVGDELEFDIMIPATPTSINGFIGGLGTSGSSSLSCSGSNGGNVRFRGEGGWFDSVSAFLLIPGVWTRLKIKKIASDDWETWQDGVSTGTYNSPGNSFLYETVGNAYGDTVFAEMSIANSKGIAQGVVFNDGMMQNSNDLTCVNTETIPNPDGFLNETQAANLSDTFDLYSPAFYRVEYSPAGSTLYYIHAYYKIKDKNSYVRFRFEHRTDNVYQDIWKVYDAEECDFDPITNTMTPNGNMILGPGVSDAVFSKTGSAGGVFTLSGHGLEVLTNGEFFVSGVKLDTTSETGVVACSKFEYRQKANVISATDNSVTDATSYRFITIDPVNLEYVVENEIKAINAFSGSFYLKILCTGHGVATKVMDEHYNTQDVPPADPEENPTFTGHDFLRIYSENQTTGLSSLSKLYISPESTAAFSYVQSFLANRNIDVKEYIEYLVTFGIGDVLKWTQTLKISKL